MKSTFFNYTLTTTSPLYAKSLMIALLALLIAACGSDDPKPDTKTFTVTFKLNGGGSDASQTVEDGKTATEPEDPTLQGHTFLGWFTDDNTFENAFNFGNTPITGDITLYAKWQPTGGIATGESYTVKFELNGGTGSIDSTTVEARQTATEPDAPTRDRYTFEGWFTDDNTFENAFDFEHTPITGAITLYAKWQPTGGIATGESYTVKFELNGGTGSIDTLTVEGGQTAAEPDAPTRDRYTFEGWFTDDNTFENAFDFEHTPITDAITLYARWEEIPFYKVAFALNGGAGSIDTLTVEGGQTATEPDAPTRKGYVFRGWFTEPASQNAFDFTDPIVEDLTLYALWETIPKFLIPDEKFRNRLRTLISDAFDDQDSLLIEHESVTQRAELNVSGQNIADLTGIAYFTALTELNCGFNQLEMLDISQNTNLIELKCNNNLLKTLDVAQHVALARLECQRNQLTSLDFSKNAALTSLRCDNNPLTGGLDISENTALTSLRCNHNQLTSLDVSENVALTSLDCYNNQLTSLDVSQNAALTSLHCNDNQLTSLDVSENAALTSLDCYSNQLTLLDVSENAALTRLRCYGNQLTLLDLSQNVALTLLLCYNNELTELDMRGMRSVSFLNINASADANPLDVLKVHEKLQYHNEIQEAKTARGAALTIDVYSALDGSTDYTLACGNYDPNTGSCATAGSN